MLILCVVAFSFGTLVSHWHQVNMNLFRDLIGLFEHNPWPWAVNRRHVGWPHKRVSGVKSRGILAPGAQGWAAAEGTALWDRGAVYASRKDVCRIICVSVCVWHHLHTHTCNRKFFSFGNISLQNMKAEQLWKSAQRFHHYQFGF